MSHASVFIQGIETTDLQKLKDRGACLTGASGISIVKQQFIVSVRLKSDFQNACKHVSLTEITLNQISANRANTTR